MTYQAKTFFKRWLMAATSLLLVSTSSLIYANNPLTKQLDALLDDRRSVTELAGMQVVLINDGDITFNYAKGMAHQSEDGLITPLTTQHKVRVASISKFVMTLGFMTLVESGQVDLNRDVSDYLGFKLRNPNFPEHPITATQLLSHTSSIRDAGVYFLPYGAQFQDFFQPSKHYLEGAHFASGNNRAPGQFFNYSNLNFGILAGIIENVSGERFDKFMDRVIFKPLSLEISFNNCRFANMNHKHIATLYRRGVGGATWDPDGPWIPQVDDTLRLCYYGGPKVSSSVAHNLDELKDYQLGSNPTLFSPQGGLRASATDLATLAQLLLSEDDLAGRDKNAILSRQAIQQMLAPVWQYRADKKNGHTGGEADPSDISQLNLQRTYGLSTHIIDLKQWGLADEQSVWYGHMAAAYGLLGQLWINPKTNQGIIILLTGMGDNPGAVPRTTPMEEVEAQVLRLALAALKNPG